MYIKLDRETQSLHCTACNREPLELSRHCLKDQDHYIKVREAFERQHANCALLMKFKNLFESQVAHA